MDLQIPLFPCCEEDKARNSSFCTKCGSQLNLAHSNEKVSTQKSKIIQQRRKMNIMSANYSSPTIGKIQFNRPTRDIPCNKSEKRPSSSLAHVNFQESALLSLKTKTLDVLTNICSKSYDTTKTSPSPTSFLVASDGYLDDVPSLKELMQLELENLNQFHSNPPGLKFVY